jgi:hypothetical protein
MIAKVKGKFVNKTQSGRAIGKPSSKAEAEARLRQIEWFKHHPQVKVRKK